jgi:hypothetical protein
MDEANIIGLLVGGIGGLVLGHILSTVFDIRNRDEPNVPNVKVAIVAGVLGAVIGGIFGIDI